MLPEAATGLVCADGLATGLGLVTTDAGAACLTARAIGTVIFNVLANSSTSAGSFVIAASRIVASVESNAEDKFKAVTGAV